MIVVYSFNKTGYEADYWTREIAASSGDGVRFVPFNHGEFADPQLYIRAQLLDNLYFARHPGLMALYAAFERLAGEVGADAVIVDNCNPYHPEVLRGWSLYKVLRAADGPLAAYDRDFAYAHAFDHVLYHSPAYSRDMGMAEKLAYCGVTRADFWPLAVFDAACDPSRSEDQVMANRRDIDVVFVGAMHVNKMPMLARVKKAFGRRCVMHGVTSLKRNLYFNAKFGFPGWIRELPFERYVPLYQRAKIGINVHNRGDYTVGGYRLFELPANGVMQISDGGDHLGAFFDVGREVVGYRDADDLIERIHYYLAHDDERRAIARAGFRRVNRDHRIGRRMRQAAEFIRRGLADRERR
jgi:glycosyltransferase involved in cell wall biosynthesis